MVATMLILELGIMLVGIVTIFVKNAPIRACVSSSTKCYQQTLPLMGATRLASEK